MPGIDAGTDREQEYSEMVGMELWQPGDRAALPYHSGLDTSWATEAHQRVLTALSSFSWQQAEGLATALHPLKGPQLLLSWRRPHQEGCRGGYQRIHVLSLYGQKECDAEDVCVPSLPEAIRKEGNK